MRNRPLGYFRSTTGASLYKIENDTVKYIRFDQDGLISGFDAYKPAGEPSFPSLLPIDNGAAFEEHWDRIEDNLNRLNND